MTKRIEFIGIPGSGKSTLFGLLIEKLKKNNKYPVVTFRDSMINNLRLRENFFSRLKIACHLRLSRSYIPHTEYRDLLFDSVLANSVLREQLSLAVERIPNGRRNRLGSLILDSLVEYAQQGKLAKDSVYVIDEGLPQRFAALGRIITPDDLNILEAFLRISGNPEILIAVFCPIRESFQRMKQRKRGIPIGFRNLSESELQEALELFERNVCYVSNYLEKLGTKTIAIRNLSIPESCRILSQVVEML